MSGWRIGLAAALVLLVNGCGAARVQTPDGIMGVPMYAADARLAGHMVGVAAVDPRTVVVLGDDHAFGVTWDPSIGGVEMTVGDAGRDVSRSRFFDIVLNPSRGQTYSATWRVPDRVFAHTALVAVRAGG